MEILIAIGLSGCGKSTEYKISYQDDYAYISSDEIRGEIYGDESIQTNPAAVFEIAHNRIEQCVRNNINVYFDATNIQRKFRVQLVQKLRKWAKAYKVECIITYLVFAERVEWCIGNDALRSRHVGTDVILRQLRQFDVPVLTEGHDKLFFINNGGYYTTEEIINRMYDFPQDNPHHTLDLLSHCMEVRRSIEQMGYILKQEYGLLHDIGKVYTKSYIDCKGNTSAYAHYYGHENASAYIALCYRWWIEPEDKLNAAWTIGFHMLPYFTERWRDKIKGRLGETADYESIIEWVNALHVCDERAH